MKTEELRKVICWIKKEKYSIRKYNNSQYRQAVVIRILNCLDWDYLNPEEMFFDYDDNGALKKYDLCIKNKNNRLLILIDNDDNLGVINDEFGYEDYLLKIVNYSQCFFYSPKLENEEFVFKMDLFTDEEDELFEKLNLVSRSSFDSGELATLIDHKMQEILQREKIEKEIRNIWNEIKNRIQ